MNVRRFFLGLLWLSLLNPAVLAGEAPISDSQARILAPAVAEILLQRESTQALLNYCGQHYPRLQQDTGQTRADWLQANQAILHKADRVQARLISSLRQTRSQFAAEKYSMDIVRTVQRSVDKFVNKLSSYPGTQQQRICNRLILSIKAGDWDVRNKQAEAVATLENFH